MSALKLWAGLECTVNRVGDQYFDQFARSGHSDRISDLDLLADIGAEAVRYPVLWERVSPDTAAPPDFSWTDQRMARLRELKVRPIVGLVHHGSGPRHTHLLDDGFAPGLAAHARATAERYPWVKDWTPVNEPLTTARFSALYGLWYPHRRDTRDMFVALLNQVDAVRLSMREIRAVNPAARLIQTEDLGYVHATPPLCEQAAMENERRWLTWDLLFGRVVEGHPFWRSLCDFGFQARLEAIAAAPCPPDVIGVNHYLTSERFLDHRLHRYPEHMVGGNGRQSYVDIEAVRIARDGALGWADILRQTWDRYGRAMAVTEAHNGCTREEQMRWMLECWRAAETLRAEGVEIEAVTAWALLGSCGWSNLLTSEAAPYECGVWDLRGGQPRATAMVGLLKALSEGRQPEPAYALASPGWWRRPDIRLEHAATRSAVRPRYAAPSGCVEEAAPILILQAESELGLAFGRACRLRGLIYVLDAQDQTAHNDRRSIEAAVARLAPAAVISAGDPGPASAEALASVCIERGVPLLCVVSDSAGRQATESSVAHSRPGVLAVRTGELFSHADDHCLAMRALNALTQEETFAAAGDVLFTPTYTPDVVDAALDLLIDGETGEWRLTHGESISPASFSGLLAESLGLDRRAVSTRSAARLRFATVSVEAASCEAPGLGMLPTLASAIERFAHGWREKRLSRGACPPRDQAFQDAAE